MQVITATKVDTQTITGVGDDSPEDFISIGLSASITPSSASSRILIIANIFASSSTGSARGFGSIFRGTSATSLGSTISNTNLSDPTSAGSRNKCFSGTFNSVIAMTVPMNFVDSPNTTSERVYEIGMAIYTTNALNINRSSADTDDGANGRAVSTLTLMEIGA